MLSALMLGVVSLLPDFPYAPVAETYSIKLRVCVVVLRCCVFVSGVVASPAFLLLCVLAFLRSCSVLRSCSAFFSVLLLVCAVSRPRTHRGRLLEFHVRRGRESFSL